MIRCPECHRKNHTEVENGRVKCRKCLQYIIIEESKAVCCVPNVIFD